MMKDKVFKLKKNLQDAKNDDERDKVESQLQELCTEDPDAFADAFLAFARDTADRAEELVIKQKLKNIMPAISMSYISKNYFKKSENWIYQRLNGNIINGKKVSFTHDEIGTFKLALNDLSKQLGSVSISL